MQKKKAEELYRSKFASKSKKPQAKPAKSRTRKQQEIDREEKRLRLEKYYASEEYQKIRDMQIATHALTARLAIKADPIRTHEAYLEYLEWIKEAM